jgi:FixJ family two-component response regulator
MPIKATNQHSPVVYLVDDDPLLLKALTQVLEVEGFEVRAFTSPRLFLSEHDCNAPGCAILDLVMPALSGLDLQKIIASAEPSRPVIFISGKNDIPASVAAMKNGAVDFLTKPFNSQALVQAVREAITKDQVARSKWDRNSELMRRFSQLTSREQEVFSHLLLGKQNKHVAEDLGITIKTAKRHRARIMQKMSARSLAELVHFAELLKSSNVVFDEG